MNNFSNQERTNGKLQNKGRDKLIINILQILAEGWYVRF